MSQVLKKASLNSRLNNIVIRTTGPKIFDSFRRNSQTHSCTQECRKLSFQNHQPVLQTTELIPAIKFVPSINVVLLNATNGEKPELTCISEEGLHKLIFFTFFQI